MDDPIERVFEETKGQALVRQAQTIKRLRLLLSEVRQCRVNFRAALYNEIQMPHALWNEIECELESLP
jgi:hypothetical protein